MKLVYTVLRNSRIVTGLAVLCILSVIQSLAADTVNPYEPDANDSGISREVLLQAEDVIQQAVNERVTPGAVLIAGNDNRIIYREAFAKRRVIPFSEPMTVDTIFDIASCSKVLGTSAMTMLLIQDGRIKLDTKVADILPGFSENEKGDVTVWNLLTHTSGLPSYCDWKAAERLRGEKTQDEALIDYIASMKKIYTTGEYYLYSCLNFLILGRVNEIIAGESMHSFLGRRIWKPLKMRSTGYILTPGQLKRTAATRSDDSLEVGIVHDPLAFYHGSGRDHCPGNAGLFMSSGDMAIMAQLILNGGIYNGVRIYSRDIVNLWTAPQINKPAFNAKKPWYKDNLKSHTLGWVVYRDKPWIDEKAPAGSFIGHSGWTGTSIWIDKYSKTFIIFNTNCIHINPNPQIGPCRKEITGLLLKSIDIYREN